MFDSFHRLAFDHFFGQSFRTFLMENGDEASLDPVGGPDPVSGAFGFFESFLSYKPEELDRKLLVDVPGAPESESGALKVHLTGVGRFIRRKKSVHPLKLKSRIWMETSDDETGQTGFLFPGTFLVLAGFFGLLADAADDVIDDRKNR